MEVLLPHCARPAEPEIGIDPAASVDPEAYVARGAAIGAGVANRPRTRISSGVVIYADCRIGADGHFGPGTVIGGVGLPGHAAGDERRGFFPHLAGVRIGNWALLGIGAILVDNVVIEAGTLVGAGSVVTRDTRTGEKLVGVPGRDVPSLRRFGPTPP